MVSGYTSGLIFHLCDKTGIQMLIQVYPPCVVAISFSTFVAEHAGLLFPLNQQEPTGLVSAAQRLPYPLIKGHTLNQIRDPTLI